MPGLQKRLSFILASAQNSSLRTAQALVATRDGLRGLLERTTVATEEEARSLEKFKEQKMGQVIWICKRLAHRTENFRLSTTT